MADGTTSAAPKIKLITDIVAAYVSHNHVARGDLPGLIASVHSAISQTAIGAPVTKPNNINAGILTAQQIRKSVQAEILVSFIDGKSYKTLKRHLKKHGFDPVSYRKHYGLPSDYPMVSPAYSEKRAHLARSIGLGQRGGQAAVVIEPAPARKGRRRAA